MDPSDLLNALLLAEHTSAALASAWDDVTKNWGLLTPRMRVDAIRVMQAKYTRLVLENNAPDTGCTELTSAWRTFKAAQRDREYEALPTDDEVTKAIVVVAKGVGKRDDI